MGVYLPGVDSGVGEESTPAISGSESESDYLDYSPGRAEGVAPMGFSKHGKGRPHPRRRVGHICKAPRDEARGGF